MLGIVLDSGYIVMKMHNLYHHVYFILKKIISVYMYVSAYITCIHIHTIHIHMNACMYVCVSVFMCMCLCVCVYMQFCILVSDVKKKSEVDERQLIKVEN